jgi:acyl carrier protein
MAREALKAEIKALLVQALKLEDLTPEEIADEAPLFGEGLGLDSIDALELAVALERRFQIAIPDQAVGKRAFANVETLACFVEEHLPRR